MAVAFQVVMSLLGLLQARFGQGGVLVSAGVLGLTDMDALTFGMNQLAQTSELIPLAARAIVLGVTVNSLFKAGIALALGTPEFRRGAVTRLAILAVAGGVGFVLIGRWAPGP